MNPLSIPVPVYLLDGGPAAKSAKGYWRNLLAGQRLEVAGTFGTTLPLPGDMNDTAGVDALPVPSVLVIPALGGGRIPKDWRGWHEFRARLARYRGRGGVVVLFEAAFHLPAEGTKTSGRGWQGMERHPGTARHVTGDVTVSRSDVDGAEAANFKTPWHIWGEWRCRDGSDGRAAPIAVAESGGESVPLAWRWRQPRGWEQPGAMLFLTSWSWVHHARASGEEYALAAQHQPSLNEAFGVYRALNLAIVQQAVFDSQRRVAERLARMEKLSGATERLPNRVGREKDYHRLLVNDADLCVDLAAWRTRSEVPDETSLTFARCFRDATVHDEPGYAKLAGRGRLDILLVSAADAAELAEGQSAATVPKRSPVAWIELEAGPIHVHQIQEFLAGHAKHLRGGDFVVCIDASSDDDPKVAVVRQEVASRGLCFLHAQVPHALDALEESYGPELHRLARKRYTLEVIRGLLG